MVVQAVADAMIKLSYVVLVELGRATLSLRNVAGQACRTERS